MKLLSILFFLTLSFNVYAGNYVIYAGGLIDGKSNTTKNNVSIVIKDDQIIAIHDGFINQIGSQAEIIDLKNYTVLPGLMDMHTHLSLQFNEDSYVERFKLNEADYAFRSVDYAKKTLLAGFTTVRDLGDKYNITIALRKAINDGIIIGPRIYTAGKSIATTGGHADPTNGYRHNLMGNPGPEDGVINGVDQARKAVRQHYKDGADLIKITATGGVLSTAKSGQNPQFMDDELEAIVSTAKDYGFTVAVHAHGAEGMKRAIRAGVDSIEHGTYMDNQVIKLMKKHGTYYVPTILAGKWVGEKAQIDGYFPAIVRPKAAAIGPQIFDTFAKAYKSGVKIAFGTDSGVSAHGDNAQEFALMIAGGMKPMKAIKSATMETAKLLKIEDTLGSIEVGKIADIIAINGNPLEDITLLEQVEFVMKAGKIYKSQ